MLSLTIKPQQKNHTNQATLTEDILEDKKNSLFKTRIINVG